MSTLVRDYITQLEQPQLHQLENIFIILDKLLHENSLLTKHFTQLEQRCEQWIHNERSFLLTRLEKLENENRLHQTYQTQTEQSLRSITNLILQILSTQQELRKEYDEQRNVTDSSHWRRTQQQVNEYSRPPVSLRPTARSFSSNQLSNDRSIWNHQVKEHDQKTRNSSLDRNYHSPTLATARPKSDKPTTARSNRLYYTISNEKPSTTTTTKSTRSTVEEAKKKAPLQTRVNNTIRDKRPIPVVRNTNTTRIPVSPPPPPPATTRVTLTTVNKKTVPSSSTANKSSPRPRYTLAKTPNEPLRTVTSTPPRPRPTQPTVSPPKPIKTRIPIPPPQSRRVTDLDQARVEKQKPKVIPPPLFSKAHVKLVRPVRSQELKLFTCHLTPQVLPQPKESQATLTSSSRESLSKPISSQKREFSEDSLNEYSHGPKLIEQISVPSGIVPISSNSTSDGYFPPMDQHFSSKKTPSTIAHRLVFPDRLGRLLFHRRVLSDSDIYRKNCSKDQEILHHVYHLDTVRDYSMDFYMLTTYASDSQLRAWLDDENDEEILRYLSKEIDEEESSSKQQGKSNEDNELDWYSELELLNSTTEQASSFSSDIHMEEFSQHVSTNSILREILNHSWTNDAADHIESDLTSSIVSEEFQSDFYYLCPITKTTSFSMNDSKS